MRSSEVNVHWKLLIITCLFFIPPLGVQSEGQRDLLVITVLSEVPVSDTLYEFANLKFRFDFHMRKGSKSFEIPIPEKSDRISLHSKDFKEVVFIKNKKRMRFEYDSAEKRKISLSFFSASDLKLNLLSPSDVVFRCPPGLMLAQSNPAGSFEGLDEYRFGSVSRLNFVIEKNSRNNFVLVILFISVILLLFTGHAVKKYLFN